MIVKDEEEVLERCLNSISDLVDEIIIVDTGSKDSTKLIASRFTDKIYDYIWKDDFSSARNYSFSKACKDFILWLDADDMLDEENRLKMKHCIETLTDHTDMVMMKYHVAFDEMNQPILTYYRERLLKRSNNYKWMGRVHEVIALSGNIVYDETGIFHKKVKVTNPKRNLQIFEKMIAEGEKPDARQQFYYGKELFENGYYDLAIEELCLFLQDENGWIENKIEACLVLSKCYRILNLNIQALKILFYSFMYDSPRAEIACEIGMCCMLSEKWTEAIFWYHLASQKKPQLTGGGFVLKDCYKFIPYIQLCVCYDKLHDFKTAEKYNELAGSIRPINESYLYNKQYFQNK